MLKGARPGRIPGRGRREGKDGRGKKRLIKETKKIKGVKKVGRFARNEGKV